MLQSGSGSGPDSELDSELDSGLASGPIAVPADELEPVGCLDDNEIVEFIDGLLSDDEMARIERHTARCDSCRRLLAELGRSPTQEPLLRGYSATLPSLAGSAHIDIQAGQQLGRFVVLSRIGRGGMGVVFAAYDPKLDRKVAIKLLHSRVEGDEQSSHDRQKRLLREAQAMAQLSHPNVIQVYDVGTYKSEAYIAMEFVDGETLSRWLLRWDRSWQDILDKFLQAGRALNDAHAASLVHRDFKPDNVLVGEDGRVRVMDFGLARWVLTDDTGRISLTEDTEDHVARARAASEGGLGHSLTKTGALLGTPRYMAPEQFTGETADARSDQFSFCVAFYEALYRQHPFERSTAFGLVEEPETTEVRPPPEDTLVPDWLHQVILRGMAGSAHERHPAMAAMLVELTPVPASPPKSSRRFIALVVIALVSMFAAVYFYNVSDTTKGELGEVVDENRALELQLDDLEDEVGQLETELRETLVKLDQARAHEEVLVGELEAKLTQTQSRLRAAIGKLEDTQKQLDRTKRQLAWAKRNPPVTPNKPRLRGLRKAEIQAQLGKYHRDLDVCLSEWSERENTGESLLAVRFQIDSKGVPQRGSRTAGITDQVVYECVVGLLEDKLRFPSSDGITVAEIGFFYQLGSLRVTVKIKDVVEDVSSPGDESAATES